MAKEERKKVFTNQFDCDLCDHISKISSITMRFPKLPSSDGRNWQYKVYQPGQPSYGNINFSGPVHGDSIGMIKQWVKDTYDGAENRKDITVNMRTHQQDAPIRSFNLISCTPTYFSFIDISADGNSGSVQQWNLEVRVNRIEMA